ncbi:hypothetical protein MXB_493, partial [Myxobolus squamalis]
KYIYLELETCLCKIFGLYKISIWNGETLKSQNFYIIMENIFYNFHVDRLYDVKGCIRKKTKKSGSSVYFDSDILETLLNDPIFVQHKLFSKIYISLRSDTRFLEDISVVDYSLIVGVNNEQNSLKVAVIDYLRKYTWDKRLESAVKSGIMIATSSGRTPTIVPPTDYRMRFMDAIKLYFFPVPTKWEYLEIVKKGSKSDVYYINNCEEEKYDLIKSCKPLCIRKVLD